MLSDRASALAHEVIARDLSVLPFTSCHGIGVNELNLHSDNAFCEVANRRRAAIRNKASNEAVHTLEAEMASIAQRVADEQITRERGFLDREPEGVALCDLPLDTDK